MQKSLNDAASVQSLFDEMFALGVSAKGEPIMKQSYDSTTFMPNPMFQVDPMDVIRLFYGRISQALLSGKDNTALNGCLARLQQCEQQLTATNSLDRSLQVMSIDALASLNKLVDDVQMALRANILDDKTWGNRVPEELLMKDMLGGLKLADVENELKFMVRGKSYLKDSEKIVAGPPLFYLRGIQVVEQPQGSTASPFNVAEQAWCGFPKGYDKYNEWFIHNYIVPGSTVVNVVCFYTASRDALEVINSISMTEFADNRAQIEYDSSITAAAASSAAGAGQGAHSAQAYNAKSPVHQDKAWSNSLYRFWAGNDDYRNRTFKLFPRVCKASWAIQAAVGTKPALIGNKKLELKYSRGANYLEVDIDLGSSTIATHILGMVRGVSKSIVVDLGVGIEGTQEDELPEAILCQARFDRCDLDGGAPIPAHLITPTVTATPAADTGAGAGAGKSAKSVKATGTAGGYASTKNAFVVGCAGTETPAQKIQRGLAEVERMRVSTPLGTPGPPPPSVSSSTTTSSRFSRKY